MAIQSWSGDGVGHAPPAVGSTVSEVEVKASATAEEPALLPQGPVGQVLLVGAGPGSPDLLTVAAVKALEQADVVLYDRLVSRQIVDLCRGELVEVGKGPELKTAAAKEIQVSIEAQLVRLAQQGKHVVRLKGGDPFIYGRGGEELVALGRAGIPCRVIPGITAGFAAAASLGLPLTYRHLTRSCLFVTGNGQGASVPYDALEAHGKGMTVVFYMARGALPAICAELSQRGLGALSFALVEHASLPEERAIVGTVNTLPDLVAAAQPPVSGACILLLGPEQIPTLRAEHKPSLAPPKALALGSTCPRRLGGRTRALWRVLTGQAKLRIEID